MAAVQDEQLVRPEPRARVPLHLSPPTPETSDSFARLLWNGWKNYSKRAATYQSQILLSVIYFLVLGPAALIAQWTGSKLLDLQRGSRSSFWIERKPVENTIDAMKRQF
jgi:hypothetical protein